MARYMGGRLQNWIESKLEGGLNLKINLEKTHVIHVNGPREYLDFLGYRFRYDRDLLGRNRKCWHWEPSPKVQGRERETLLVPRHRFMWAQHAAADLAVSTLGNEYNGPVGNAGVQRCQLHSSAGCQLSQIEVCYVFASLGGRFEWQKVIGNKERFTFP